jgi:hypothetical protein
MAGTDLNNTGKSDFCVFFRFPMKLFFICLCEFSDEKKLIYI